MPKRKTTTDWKFSQAIQKLVSSRIGRRLHLHDPVWRRAILLGLVLAVFGVVVIVRSLAASNPNLPGDLNNDNKVNVTDLSILLTNFGKTTSTGDINGDGRVNVTDLSILLSNFNKTYTPGNPTPTPPTPTPPTPPPPAPAPAAPTNLQIITGGNSVVALWDLSPGTAKTEVYRDNQLVATVVPGQGVLRGDKLGTRYIDKSITKGTTYQYKVRSINASGTASAYSTVVSAKPPTNTTPVPTVTVDASLAPDLANWLNTYAKPEVETWYPKISDAIAYPDYTPTLNITLLPDPNYTKNIAIADGVAQNIIRVNADFVRQNPEDAGGLFVHETTHTIELYPGGVPGYITEGVADWSRDWFTRERFHVPAPSATLANGYSEGAYMLQWAEKKYSPGIIKKVNVAAHKGTYSDSLFTSATGKTAEQLFTEAKASNYGNTGAVKNGSGNCLDITSAGGTNGTQAQMSTCNNSAGQKWLVVYLDGGPNGTAARQKLGLANTSFSSTDSKCLDVASSGTAENNKVHSWTCDFGNAQTWIKNAGGSLQNPNAAKCLAPTANGTAAGTTVTILNCNGSSAQAWTLP